MFVTTANGTTFKTAPGQDGSAVHSRIYGAGETADRQSLFSPKQKSEHGLTPEQLILDEEALMKVIREYTRESGVRNLEQQVVAVPQSRQTDRHQ